MDAGAQALAGAELTNGLECKITCETSKARRLKTLPPLPASPGWRARAALTRVAACVPHCQRTRHATAHRRGVPYPTLPYTDAPPRRAQVSYVLDTEDVFRRPKPGAAAPGAAAAAAAARTRRFASWLETRHAASQIMGV